MRQVEEEREKHMRAAEEERQQLQLRQQQAQREQEEALRAQMEREEEQRRLRLMQGRHHLSFWSSEETRLHFLIVLFSSRDSHTEMAKETGRNLGCVTSITQHSSRPPFFYPLCTRKECAQSIL